MDVAGSRRLSRACATLLLLLFVTAHWPGAGRAQALDPAELPTSDPVPAGSVVSRLQTGSVALGETVALTVIATGVQGELDTRALEQVFDIVGRSSSAQVDVINGQRRDRTSWVLELSARRVGVFTVPPVTVGGVTSDLQTLEVTSTPDGAERDMFVEAEVDETSPWVQGQVILTLRVFQAIEFLDASLGEPRADGLRVQRLGEDQRRRERRDGREYDVTERRYALFAQRSGPIVIEPVALDATVPVDPDRVRGFFTPSRRVLRRTEAIELQVRGQPPGSNGWWFPARSVTLAGEWSGMDPSQAVPDGSDAATRVGVPVTRTLTLSALGSMPTQLPDIEPPVVSGASLYDEEPRIGEQAGEAGLTSEQRIAWAVVPTEPGSLELPAISVEWFDTVAGRTRTASLPASRLHVEPATGDDPAPSVAAPVSNSPDEGDASPNGSAADQSAGSAALVKIGVTGTPGGDVWRWATLAALIGWTLTVFGWWRSVTRRHGKEETGTTKPPDSGRALQRVKAGESTASPRELAATVLAWARTRWPDSPPASLPALAHRLAGAPAAGVPVARTLLELDAGLYARSGEGSGWAGAKGLADRLEAAAAEVGDRPGKDGAGRHGSAVAGSHPGSLPTL